MVSNPMVSVKDLKQLLIAIKDQHTDICIRFRLMGEMWKTNFMPIASVGERDAFFYFKENNNNKLVYVNDMSTIMQFEIDKPFEDFSPHFHYEVAPKESDADKNI